MTPPPTDRRLFLFDIDGTLITSGGAGEGALRDAMKSRFGVDDDLSGVVLAGSTDARIAAELLGRAGIAPTPENAAALLDEYLHHLPRRLAGHDGRILPGIIELLEALAPRPDCVLALLTGNVIRGAEIKLRHFGVWHHFEFGAFSDDHADRNELGKFARARAMDRHGIDFPPEKIYVIGDTPRDIECGRAIGARTVAIATGIHGEEALAEHSPDFLFRDFSGTGAILAALFA